MPTTSVHIDQGTAEALIAQARAKGMTLDTYLKELVGLGTDSTPNGSISTAQLDRYLDELSTDGGNLPVLPADFSRADLYGDHD